MCYHGRSEAVRYIDLLRKVPCTVLRLMWLCTLMRYIEDGAYVMFGDNGLIFI